MIPGGRLEVRYKPADKVGVLYLCDAGETLTLHAEFIGISGNWGVSGYWLYRDGFGQPVEFIRRMHEEERARWRVTGEIRPRPAERLPLLHYRRREGVYATRFVPRLRLGAEPNRAEMLCLYVMPDGDTLPYWERVAGQFAGENYGERVCIELCDDWVRGHRSPVEELRRGNFAPDLVHIPSRWLGTYVAEDLLAPLDELLLVDLLHAFIREPDLLGACRWQGRLYGLPISSSVRGLFCNRRFVAHPPRDWDELVAAARDAMRNGAPYGLGLELAGAEGHANLYNFLWGNRADLFDERGELALGTSQAIGALRFLERLVDQGLTNPCPWETTRDRLRKLWQDQQVAMAVHTPWVTRWTPYDFQIGAFPTQAGPATWLNIDCLAIPRAALHKDAVARFLHILYQDDNHLEFCQTFMKMPVTSSVLRAPFFTDDRHLARLVELLPQSRAVPVHPSWEPAAEALVSAVAEILQGALQPEAIPSRVRSALR